MEIFEAFTGLLIIVWLVGLVALTLNVVLFFKIWSMTNDVREIKLSITEWLDIEYPHTTDLVRTTKENLSTIAPSSDNADLGS